MDILREYGIMVDCKNDSLKYKMGEEKIHLKLTPRKIIFKTKQLKEYFEFMRKGRAIVKANEVEE